MRNGGANLSFFPQEEDFKKASIENARNSVQEPGVVRFDVLQDVRVGFRLGELDSAAPQCNAGVHWCQALCSEIHRPLPGQIEDPTRFKLVEVYDGADAPAAHKARAAGAGRLLNPRLLTGPAPGSAPTAIPPAAPIRRRRRSTTPCGATPSPTGWPSPAPPASAPPPAQPTSSLPPLPSLHLLTSPPPFPPTHHHLSPPRRRRRHLRYTTVAPAARAQWNVPKALASGAAEADGDAAELFVLHPTLYAKPEQAQKLRRARLSPGERLPR